MSETVLSAIEEVNARLLRVSDDENTARILESCQRLYAFTWLLDAVRFYRSLGFFADTKALSEAEVAQSFLASREEEIVSIHWPNEHIPLQWLDLARFDKYSDFKILMKDKQRVWFNDLECDVCEEHRSYTYLLQDLSRISRGFFQAENIHEEWRYFDKRKVEIQVFFMSKGKNWSFEPCYQDDWLDLHTPLVALNQIIGATGYEFTALDTGDQCACVVVLDQQEKREILNSRNLGEPEYFTLDEYEKGDI